MTGGKRFSDLIEALLCSLGLIVFSFFIQDNYPWRLVSFLGLIGSAYIISRKIRSLTDLKKITGAISFSGNTLIYTIIGIAIGTALTLLYRWHLGIEFLPHSFHGFTIVAALIGCMEEFVFRGFLQESTKRSIGPYSVIFSALAHTGYKCCLFLNPAVSSNIDISFLAIWTLLAGLIFGIIRHLSKSLLPSAAAHMFFDILVYAEFVSAPWWVW